MSEGFRLVSSYETVVGDGGGHAIFGGYSEYERIPDAGTPVAEGEVVLDLALNETVVVNSADSAPEEQERTA